MKQGDPLSPKLFTATLEEVFKRLKPKWAEKGIVVGDSRLTNLRFADDIVLFSPTAAELGDMLQGLNQASRPRCGTPNEYEQDQADDQWHEEEIVRGECGD